MVLVLVLRSLADLLAGYRSAFWLLSCILTVAGVIVVRQQTHGSAASDKLDSSGDAQMHAE